MTDEVMQKLRAAFLMGATDEEACAYADIAPRTLYYYQAENPEYLQEKEKWKQNPILKAKATVFKNLDDKDVAKWYLERKKKDEFAPRQEHTGEGGRPIEIVFHPVLKQAPVIKAPIIDGKDDITALPTPRKPDQDTPENQGG